MSTRKPNHSSSNLISVASRLLSTKLQEGLIQKNLDITLEQWTLMYYLWEQDGVTQNELASHANKEKSTITRHLDALVKKHLISRESHPTDKRNKMIVLTEKGRSIKEEALESARKITNKAEKEISEKDIQIFKTVLSQMISNINEED